MIGRLAKMTDILILDDDQGVRDNLVAYLEDEGFDCLASETGLEGMKLLAEHSNIRLSIVDLRLPDISGVELIESIKGLYPDMGCMVHTGSVEFELNDRLLNLGLVVSDLFYKPLMDVKPLLKRICDYVQKT
jgi:two-component system OmpR family response regulator